MNADNDTLVLWCIVSGDSRPFTVRVPTDDYISVLKERIHEKAKNGVLKDIDAKDLDLWKFNESTIPIKPDETLNKRVHGLGVLSSIGEKLAESSDKVG